MLYIYIYTRTSVSSHEILRPFPALGRLPIDILRRYLNVACFAMDTTVAVSHR